MSEQKQATDLHEGEHKVFDFNEPVTEAEWWARGRIEQLEAKLETYESIISGNNTMLEVAEHREAELRAENKRLREALEARRDWFAAQLKSASKGNFSEWDRYTLQEECDAADEALS